MNEIDVHIITRPNERKDWLDECIESLKNEPVNIHMVEGIDNNIGKGRALGFSQGSAPYVSFVDPDDIVVAGAYQECLERMTDDCCGVFTDEILIDEYGNYISDGLSTNVEGWTPKLMYSNPAFLHHVAVGKRKHIDKFLPRLAESNVLAEWEFHFNLAHRGIWIHAPIVGYKWRKHENNSHKKYKKKQYRLDRSKAMLRINNVYKLLEAKYSYKLGDK